MFTRSVRDYWLNKLSAIQEQDSPMLPKPKKFKAKHSLPKLNDYGLKAPDWYWDHFPENLVEESKSLIDGGKLRAMAIECGYPDIEHLDKVIKWIVNGADIGCEGVFREASHAKNAASALVDGEKVSDCIADWIQKQFAYGPVPLEQIPKNAKVSCLMTRPKPNGAVRVILNLSSPKGQSVNEGINTDKYPAKMSSTAEWLKVLNSVGKNCKICKVDYADAYKHIGVRQQDTDLQWFIWLGMAFKELCLIFGSASSAGIFDAVAKIVLFIVIKKSGFKKEWTIQHLDDCCGACPHDSDRLEIFDNTFKLVAEQIGIKLAPRVDRDKSFGPSTKGVILGVEYDTVAWTWGIPEEKLTRIIHAIDDMVTVEVVEQGNIWSLVGKILNILPLVPGAKFHIDHLIRANNVSLERSHMVKVEAGFKSQLCFWRTILPLVSGDIPIPRVDSHLAPWVMEFYTDAAGGSCRDTWHGVGAVTDGWWAYLIWGRKINSGEISIDGRKLDSVMSALELVGPLLVVSAGYKWCRFAQVRVWVDNYASCIIWRKGYSYKCRLSTTLVKAISTVAVGIGCSVHVQKISRCSNAYASMADAISKGKLAKCRQIAENQGIGFPAQMAWVPRALKEWIINPSEDDRLGHKILLELSSHTNVLSYNC